MARCGTCGGEVLLAFTTRGHVVPVQPGLAPRGTLVMRAGRRKPRPGLWRARYLRGDDRIRPGERYATAHWDASPVCGQARQLELQRQRKAKHQPAQLGRLETA